MYNNIVFRNVEKNDMKSLWNMMNKLDYETKFMMYEPGERPKNIDRLEENLSNAINGKDLFLLAVYESEIVGFISAQIGQVKRTKHSAYIVVGIRKEYHNHGIGTEFLKRLNDWALDNKLLRLELTVICNNQRALNLYKKSGFEIEGTKKKSMYIDGEYVDEYYMSKMIENV